MGKIWIFQAIKKTGFYSIKPRHGRERETSREKLNSFLQHHKTNAIRSNDIKATLDNKQHNDKYRL